MAQSGARSRFPGRPARRAGRFRTCTAGLAHRDTNPTSSTRDVGDAVNAVAREAARGLGAFREAFGSSGSEDEGFEGFPVGGSVQPDRLGPCLPPPSQQRASSRRKEDHSHPYLRRSPPSSRLPLRGGARVTGRSQGRRKKKKKKRRRKAEESGKGEEEMDIENPTSLSCPPHSPVHPTRRCAQGHPPFLKLHVRMRGAVDGSRPIAIRGRRAQRTLRLSAPRRVETSVARLLLARAKKAGAVAAKSHGGVRGHGVARRLVMPSVSSRSLRVIRTPKRFIEDGAGGYYARAPPPPPSTSSVTTATSRSSSPLSPGNGDGDGGSVSQCNRRSYASSSSSLGSASSVETDNSQSGAEEECEGVEEEDERVVEEEERGDGEEEEGEDEEEEAECEDGVSVGSDSTHSASRSSSPEGSSDSQHPASGLTATTPIVAPHPWLPLHPYLVPRPPQPSVRRSVLRQPTFCWRSNPTAPGCDTSTTTYSSAKFAKAGLIRRPVFDNIRLPPLTPEEVGLAPPRPGLTPKTTTSPVASLGLARPFPASCPHLPQSPLAHNSRNFCPGLAPSLSLPFGRSPFPPSPPPYASRRPPLLRAPTFTPTEAHLRIYEVISLPEDGDGGPGAGACPHPRGHPHPAPAVRLPRSRRSSSPSLPAPPRAPRPPSPPDLTPSDPAPTSPSLVPACSPAPTSRLRRRSTVVQPPSVCQRLPLKRGRKVSRQHPPLETQTPTKTVGLEAEGMLGSRGTGVWGSRRSGAEKKMRTRLLQRAKARLHRIGRVKAPQTPPQPRGPRIKHVCRRAAVALGLPRAMGAGRSPRNDKPSTTTPPQTSPSTASRASPRTPATRVVNPASKEAVGPRSGTRKARRSRRCGTCSGCRVEEDCGRCANCLDKPKFGGRNVKKQCCKIRKCQNLQFYPQPAKATDRPNARPTAPSTETTPSGVVDPVVPSEPLAPQPVQATPPRRPGRPPAPSRKQSRHNASSLSSPPPPPLPPPPPPLPPTPPPLSSYLELPSPIVPTVSKSNGNAIGGAGLSVLVGAIDPWRRGSREKGGRLRVDLREERELEAVWSSGGLAVVTSCPIAPRALCLLCSSKGMHEMVWCAVCCQPFHMFCLEGTSRPHPGELDSWTCQLCKACHVCGRQNKLLECAKCHKSYHAECLGPNYPKALRRRLWVCRRCVRCKSCGATTPGDGGGVGWSHDFSLCHGCSKLFDKGNFCPVCNKCYLDDDYESQMMQCARCDRWVHARCEQLSDELYEVLSWLPDSVPYTCPKCSDGSPPGWRRALSIQLHTGLRVVIAALCASRSVASLLKTPSFQDNHGGESATGKAAANPITVEMEPRSLDAVLSRVEQGAYGSVLNFAEDVIRMLRMAVEGSSPLAPEVCKACSSAKALFIRQMEKAFPWFDVKRSRCWELGPESQSGLLPNAILPPSADHNYAQFRDAGGESEAGGDGRGDGGEIRRLHPPRQIIPAPGAARPNFGPLDEAEDGGDGEVPAHVTDTRQCLLCLQYGDMEPNESGRLLSLGPDEWTHVNCAVWSAEVYEEGDGALRNVPAAVWRGRQLRCDKCGGLGATVGCALPACQANYHFMCGRALGACFLEHKAIYCPQHRGIAHGEEVVAEGFAVNRRVFVDPDRLSLRRKFITGLEPRSISIAIGSLTVERLGYLSELSDSANYLFPVGFRCTRLYWSTRDARRRCLYTVRILEQRTVPDHGQPDVNSTVKHGDGTCSLSHPLVVSATSHTEAKQNHNLHSQHGDTSSVSSPCTQTPSLSPYINTTCTLLSVSLAAPSPPSPLVIKETAHSVSSGPLISSSVITIGSQAQIQTTVSKATVTAPHTHPDAPILLSSETANTTCTTASAETTTVSVTTIKTASVYPVVRRPRLDSVTSKSPVSRPQHHLPTTATVSIAAATETALTSRAVVVLTPPPGAPHLFSRKGAECKGGKVSKPGEKGGETEKLGGKEDEGLGVTRDDHVLSCMTCSRVYSRKSRARYERHISHCGANTEVQVKKSGGVSPASAVEEPNPSALQMPPPLRRRYPKRSSRSTACYGLTPLYCMRSYGERGATGTGNQNERSPRQTPLPDSVTKVDSGVVRGQLDGTCDSSSESEVGEEEEEEGGDEDEREEEEEEEDEEEDDEDEGGGEGETSMGREVHHENEGEENSSGHADEGEEEGREVVAKKMVGRMIRPVSSLLSSSRDKSLLDELPGANTSGSGQFPETPSLGDDFGTILPSDIMDFVLRNDLGLGDDSAADSTIDGLAGGSGAGSEGSSGGGSGVAVPVAEVNCRGGSTRTNLTSDPTAFTLPSDLSALTSHSPSSPTTSGEDLPFDPSPPALDSSPALTHAEKDSVVGHDPTSHNLAHASGDQASYLSDSGPSPGDSGTVTADCITTVPSVSLAPQALTSVSLGPFIVLDSSGQPLYILHAAPSVSLPSDHSHVSSPGATVGIGPSAVVNTPTYPGSLPPQPPISSSLEQGFPQSYVITPSGPQGLVLAPITPSVPHQSPQGQHANLVLSTGSLLPSPPPHMKSCTVSPCHHSELLSKQPAPEIPMSPAIVGQAAQIPGKRSTRPRRRKKHSTNAEVHLTELQLEPKVPLPLTIQHRSPDDIPEVHSTNMVSLTDITLPSNGMTRSCGDQPPEILGSGLCSSLPYTQASIPTPSKPKPKRNSSMREKTEGICRRSESKRARMDKAMEVDAYWRKIEQQRDLSPGLDGWEPNSYDNTNGDEKDLDEDLCLSPLLALLQKGGITRGELDKDGSCKRSSRPALLFEISNDEGFFFKACSIEEAWKAVTDRVQEARTNARLQQLSFSGANGIVLSGLSHCAVLYLLEQLQGADSCREHHFLYHRPGACTTTVPNPHGCARADPFLRRSPFDLFNFLASQHRQPPAEEHDDDSDEDSQLHAARRATSSDLPLAMRFRHLKKTSREAVGVYRSPIHGRGLFCKHPMEAGEMVIEYSGVVIRSALTDKREQYYQSKGLGCYMFRMDDAEVVDATTHGNAARFINHSCEPNCYSRIVSLDGQKHIVILALRRIRRGEELTYDYKFPIEGEASKLPCNCGARRCRKSLN